MQLSCTQRFALTLFALSLLVISPLWIATAYLWSVDTDLIFYATILKLFSAQLWQGDLYPRWLVGANDGMGSPVFLFYGPVPYYIMSAFEWLSPWDSSGMGRVILGLALAVFFAGISSYYVLRLWFDENSARYGALVYAFFPFWLIVIFIWFAMAQMWAIALAPVLLIAAHKVAQQGLRAVPFFACSYMLFSLTHLPTAFIFLGIPIMYAIALTPRPQRWKCAFHSFIGAGLGVAASAFYLLPAICNKMYIKESGFLEGKFNYAHNFLDLPSMLGICVIVLPLLGFFMELPRPKCAHLTFPTTFWLVILAMLLLLVLPLSAPLWHFFTPMHFLQSPVRFFNVMAIAVVFIATQWRPYVRSRYAYALMFLPGLAVTLWYSSSVLFFAGDKHTQPIIAAQLISVPEYSTPWMEKAGIDVRFSVPELLRNMPEAAVTDGEGWVEVQFKDARHIALSAHITSPEAIIRLRQFYFPGWVADNFEIIEKSGFLAVHAPHGEQLIQLYLPWYAGEQLGDIISVGAFLIISLLWLMTHPLQRRHKKTITNPL